MAPLASPAGLSRDNNTNSNNSGNAQNVPLAGFIKQTEDTDIERTAEYARFIQSLREYHIKRGTTLQNNGEPALGPRRLDLLKLYRKVLARGGYDAVSEQSMAWRKIAEDYNCPPMSNAGMPGYLLKTIYYKNLCAYEIEHHWGKKPPPPELLEQMTARGGAIMKRPEMKDPQVQATMLAQRREQIRAQKAANTPQKEPKTHATPSRPPPIAQPQQPPAQVTMMQTGPMHPPSYGPVPGYGSITGVSQHYQNPFVQNINLNAPSTGQPYGMPPRPANSNTRLQRTATSGPYDSATLTPGAQDVLHPIPVPVPDATGPLEPLDTRVTRQLLGRIMLSLKSGMTDEVAWAMGLLMRAAYELGDEVQFEHTPGLAETLLMNVQRGIEAVNVLAPPTPTSDSDEAPATKRLRTSTRYFATLKPIDNVQQYLDAALVLRNLALNTDNAKYLGKLPNLTDVLVGGLKLGAMGNAQVELRGYCMELTDLLATHLSASSEEDAIYRALVVKLSSHDRADLVCGLRVLTRLSCTDDNNRLLQDVKLDTIGRLSQLADQTDPELAGAICDFLFQYTTYRANVRALVESEHLRPLLQKVLELLDFDSEVRVEQVPVAKAASSIPARAKAAAPQRPSGPPDLPQDIIDDLLRMQEPSRAIAWMRASFEDDASDDVTQIQLWQSYRGRFQPHVVPTTPTNPTDGSPAPPKPAGVPLLPAADLIKMVGNAFAGAQAMVVPGPDGNRFIIRGIRPRAAPVSPSGRRHYHACKWVVDEAQKSTCSAFFATPGDLFSHVCKKHIDIALKSTLPAVANGALPSGTIPQTNATATPVIATPTEKISCGWAGCGRFHPPDQAERRHVKRHVLIHMPDEALPDTPAPSVEKNAPATNKSSTNTSAQTPATTRPSTIDIVRRITPRDDKNDARGTALAATLILRNVIKSGDEIPQIRKTLTTNIHIWHTLQSRLLLAIADDAALAPQLTQVLARLQTFLHTETTIHDEV
ncbi:Chromatin structure-remodeling complex protein rsc9 [Savitreella phatthalungensis]